MSLTSNGHTYPVRIRSTNPFSPFDADASNRVLTRERESPGDAYTGYDALYATGRIREIGYWAHARRGFVEALTTDMRAALPVALIQQLYDVERPDYGPKIASRAARPLPDPTRPCPLIWA